MMSLPVKESARAELLSLARQRQQDQSSVPTELKPPEMRLLPFDGASDEEELPRDDLATRLYKSGYRLDDEAGWSDTPQLLTQYADPRFQGTWRETPVKTEVLLLNDKAQLDRYNDLHARCEPHTAPRVVFQLEPRIDCHAGQYSALVVYREVQYRKVLRDDTPLPQTSHDQASSSPA